MTTQPGLTSQPNYHTLIGSEHRDSTPALSVISLDYRPDLQGNPGEFDPAVIIGIADGVATRCALQHIDPQADPKPFPLTVHLSSSILRPAKAGTVTVEARPAFVSPTRVVVECTAYDADRQPVLTVTTVHLYVAGRVGRRIDG